MRINVPKATKIARIRVRFFNEIKKQNSPVHDQCAGQEQLGEQQTVADHLVGWGGCRLPTGFWRLQSIEVHSVVFFACTRCLFLARLQQVGHEMSANAGGVQVGEEVYKLRV